MASEMEKRRRLFDVKTTQIIMVRDRGFDITAEQALLGEDDTYDARFTLFNDHYSRAAREANLADFRYALSQVYYHSTRSITLTDGQVIPEPLYVFYGVKGKANKVPKDVIEKFAANTIKYYARTGILVINGNLNKEGANEALAVHEDKQVYWQVFSDAELAFPVIYHQRVPRHEALSELDGRNKLIELRTTSSQIKPYPLNDKIVQYYGWKLGTVIKIYQNLEGTGNLVNLDIGYRLVAPSQD